MSKADKKEFTDSDFDEIGAIPDAAFDEIGAIDESDISTEDPRETVITGSAPKISKMEAFSEGMKSGGTLGHSDEISGASQSLPDLFQQILHQYDLAGPSVTQVNKQLSEQGFTGDIGPTEASDLYKEVRDEARAREKLAMETHPKTYMAGTAVGGMAIPGGITGQVGRGAGFGKNVLKGAMTGGTLGGVSGFGTSEAETLPELAIDTVTGMGAGTLAGLAFPALQGSVTGGLNLAKTSGNFLFGKPIEALKKEAQGTKLFGEGAATTIGKQMTETGKKVGTQMQNRAARLAKLKNRILKRAEERGVKIDKDKLDAMLKEKLEYQPESNLPEVDREISALQKILRDVSEGKLVKKKIVGPKKTKQQQLFKVEELKRAEQRAIESGVDPNDIETVFESTGFDDGEVAAVIRQAIRDEDGNITGYKKLYSTYVPEKEIPEFAQKTKIVQEPPRDLTSPKQADILRKDVQTRTQLGSSPYKTDEAQRLALTTTKEIRNLIRDKIPALEPTDDAIYAINNAADILGIKDLRNADPRKMMEKFVTVVKAQQDNIATAKAKQLADDFIGALEQGDPKFAKQVSNDIKKFADLVDLKGMIDKTLSWTQTFQTGRKIGTTAGALAGRGIHNVKHGTRELVQQTPDWFRNMAEKTAALGTESAQRLAADLMRVAETDAKARSAVLFSIMQNPDYRQMLQKVGDMVEKDESENIR